MFILAIKILQDYNVNNKFKYHLASWDIIALPKQYGGWGLKNLLWFFGDQFTYHLEGW